MLCPGMPFQGDTLEHKSLGGSETAGLYMARELKKLGHHVTVFSGTDKPGEYDGVIYRSAGEFSAYQQMAPHDISIVQRMPEAFANKTNSKLNLLWCHDLALGRQSQQFKGALWNVDAIFVVSEYMKQQYQEVYDLPLEVLSATRNGIELARFEKLRAAKIPRDRYKLMYCARPERGLDVLLKAIFPKILAQEPRARLHLAGYDNTVAHMRDFYGDIDRLIQGFGDRVVWLGHLTKDQLYAHYLSAGMYVYPTPSPFMPMFREVSCISAMECMAAGIPVVTSSQGALPETLPPTAGALIEGNPADPAYQTAFVEAVVRLLHDDAAWQAASAAGQERAQQLDWSGVAQAWSDQFTGLLAARNDDPIRLARHFIRQSDIVAAQTVLATQTGDHADELRGEIDRLWGFSKTSEGLREQYERIGQTHTDVFAHSATEPRFAVLRDWLQAHPQAERVLDFGCAHGSYAVNMCNQVGRTWVGVDIDKHSIDWAERNRQTRATTPGALTFLVGDHTLDLSGQAPFDVVWLGEVLEHVPEPWVLVDALERWVKPGGHVLISVPYGPWEYLSYDTYPHRAHLWNFDAHDIREMFLKKKKLTLLVHPFTKADVLDEPLGWHIIEYEVHAPIPTGTIDLARKLRIQRPRQTVSANVIAGPGAEETLHWCLRSLKHVVDEIVVVNTGMSEEGLRVLQQYPVRVVQGPDPKTEGFESPRNEGLKHCRMDWVFWIDTDERLMDPERMQKYFRFNLFNGYGIRQHHFACDTVFKPDMPVRFFRRTPYDGRTMRWYGMIHEHPELGLNEGPGPTIIISDSHIAHMGYLTESIRRARFARNLPMLQKDIETYPERLLQKHFIMRDNMLLVMYELQQNGGKVTDQTRQRCEETVALYRQYFLGRPGYLNVDSLQYYSQAVSVLGRGFEVAFQIAAGKDSANPNGAEKYRYDTRDDFEKDLMKRAAEAVGPFASAWY